MQFELRLLSSVQSHCRAVRRKTHREAAQVLGNTCFRTQWCCCHVVSKKGPSLPETVNNFHVAYDLKPMKHQTGRLNPPPSPDFRRTLAKDNLPKAVGPGNRPAGRWAPPHLQHLPDQVVVLNAPRPPPSSQCQKVNSVLNQWLSPRTITPVTVQICSPAASPVILS